jgi:peptidoglycan/LPS O-acetylase OafA/YrhL
MRKLDNAEAAKPNPTGETLKLTLNALSQEASVFLNIIRLVACELVVVSHFITRYQPMVLDSFFFGGMLGGLGVFTFFAISGFLISYSLLQKLQNKQYSFRNYFVDRFSRIYTGLLPALLFSAAIVATMYLTNVVYFNYLSEIESPLSIHSLAATIVMGEMFPTGLFNASSAALGIQLSPPLFAPFGFNSVLWSLVVEWWIYMFFGWLIIGSLSFFGKRERSTSYKVLFFGGLAVLSVILVALAWSYSVFIIIWFTGVLMMAVISNATVRSKLTNPGVVKVLAAFCAASLTAVTYEAYVICTLTHESFNLLFGLLIALNVFLGILLLSGNIQWLAGWMLKKRVVKYSSNIAGFSYTLFLIHYPVILFLNGLNFEVDRLLLFVPILLLINEVALLLATVGEKKHRQLAKKIKSTLHISGF